MNSGGLFRSPRNSGKTNLSETIFVCLCFLVWRNPRVGPEADLHLGCCGRAHLQQK